MKIVCDTNILISAYVFPGGPPDRIVNLARMREVTLCLSPDILTEFRKVLEIKFKYSSEEVERFTQRLILISQMVYPKERVNRITRKESDNRILECAAESEADYLITGDKRDILPLQSFGKVKILTAAEFLTILKKS